MRIVFCAVFAGDSEEAKAAQRRLVQTWSKLVDAAFFSHPTKHKFSLNNLSLTFRVGTSGVSPEFDTELTDFLHDISTYGFSSYLWHWPTLITRNSALGCILHSSQAWRLSRNTRVFIFSQDTFLRDGAVLQSWWHALFRKANSASIFGSFTSRKLSSAESNYIRTSPWFSRTKAPRLRLDTDEIIHVPTSGLFCANYGCLKDLIWPQPVDGQGNPQAVLGAYSKQRRLVCKVFRHNMLIKHSTYPKTAKVLQIGDVSVCCRIRSGIFFNVKEKTFQFSRGVQHVK